MLKLTNLPFNFSKIQALRSFCVVMATLCLTSALQMSIFRLLLPQHLYGHLFGVQWPKLYSHLD